MRHKGIRYGNYDSIRPVATADVKREISALAGLKELRYALKLIRIMVA